MLRLPGSRTSVMSRWTWRGGSWGVGGKAAGQEVLKVTRGKIGQIKVKCCSSTSDYNL